MKPIARHALARDSITLRHSLVSAFEHDPVNCWMFDDPETRLPLLEAWIEFAVDAGMGRGHFYCSEDARAGAIWSPPDAPFFDDVWGPRFVETLNSLIGERAPHVLAELGGALGRHFDEEGPPEPHFYLFMLGTHQDHQSRGLGAAVVERVLQVCDREGLEARLESSNIANVPFYERLGFEVEAEIELGEGGPVLRPMWRRPR